MEHLHNEMISRYFSHAESLWLPKWSRLATAEDGLTPYITENLIKTFTKLDQLRDYFNRPINIHIAYRPPLYNELVKGAKDSTHMMGLAVDFDVKSLSCETAISMILRDDLLEKLDLRMENNGKNPGWIHTDLRPVLPGGNRFFIP